MYSKMHWSKLYIIYVVKNSLIRFIKIKIHYSCCVYHKILDSHGKINKLNNCYDSCDKANCHYTSEHRFLIYTEYPLALKLSIDFS